MITLEKKPVWHITLEMTAKEIGEIAEVIEAGLRECERKGVAHTIRKPAEDLYEVIKDVKP